MRVFDHKEAINIDPSVFSDESMLRVLISRWDPNKIKISEADRGADVRKDWIDRSWWSVNIDKLYNGEYFICNFLRPFSDNYNLIEPIVYYIYDTNDIKKDEVILNG